DAADLQGNGRSHMSLFGHAARGPEAPGEAEVTSFRARVHHGSGQKDEFTLACVVELEGNPQPGRRSSLSKACTLSLLRWDVPIVAQPNENGTPRGASGGGDDGAGEADEAATTPPRPEHLPLHESIRAVCNMGDLLLRTSFPRSKRQPVDPHHDVVRHRRDRRVGFKKTPSCHDFLGTKGIYAGPIDPRGAGASRPGGVAGGGNSGAETDRALAVGFLTGHCAVIDPFLEENSVVLAVYNDYSSVCKGSVTAIRWLPPPPAVAAGNGARVEAAAASGAGSGSWRPQVAPEFLAAFSTGHMYIFSTADGTVERSLDDPLPSLLSNGKYGGGGGAAVAGAGTGPDGVRTPPPPPLTPVAAGAA
ncbi:unnamed protein product, partial [Phaeothamnion confervicola]